MTGQTFDTLAVPALRFAEALTSTDRAIVAWATLTRLDRADAVAVAEAALPAIAPPEPPFIAPDQGEAELWAACATRDERRVYAVALFQAMERGDRRAFAKWAGRAA